MKMLDDEERCQQEMMIPDRGLPFRLFRFEGGAGNYIREVHRHFCIEIFAVKSGKLDFYLSGRKYTLEAGKFVIVNSNEIHSVHALTPNETIVLQFSLNSREWDDAENRPIRFSHENRQKDAEIFRLITEMYQLSCDRKTGYEFLLQSEFYRLQYFLRTDYLVREEGQKLYGEEQRMKRLDGITGYLREHYAEDISLEILASRFGYSPTYLSRMFRQYARINYKDYLRMIRFEHAVKDLQESELTIGEIALNHGFPNSKAFSTLFRKQYGMLPHEYQKTYCFRKSLGAQPYTCLKESRNFL